MDDEQIVVVAKDLSDLSSGDLEKLLTLIAGKLDGDSDADSLEALHDLLMQTVDDVAEMIEAYEE